MPSPVSLCSFGTRETGINRDLCSFLSSTGPMIEVAITKTNYENIAHDDFHRGMFYQAIDGYRKVLRNRPNYYSLRLSLAAALLRVGQWDEAKAEYDACKQTPFGVHNLALLAAYEGDRDKAVSLMHQCLAQEPSNPQMHHDLGAIHLLYGEWEQGWQEYEWRWLMGANKSQLHDPLALWDGKADGDVLLVPEQGAGDTFMFARYASLVPNPKTLVTKANVGEVLGRTPGIGTIAEKAKGQWHCPLASLPRLLHPSPVWDGPYISVEAPEQSSPRPFRVGICWKGSPLHGHDGWRSALVEDFAPLAKVPGINLVSLQVPQASIPWPCETPTLTAYAETARVIAGLDLVISVDTSVAHLAGAMGKPTWTLLSKIMDWRWGVSGDSTPWYPSMRLFRQTKLNDWAEVISRVVLTLSEMYTHARPS